MDAIAEAAAAARPGWEALGPAGRAAALRAVAGALDARAGELAALADTETALGSTRLTGEVARTTGQLRMFADVLEDGGYLDVITSPPAQGVPGLRRMVRPVGPVAVFSASNFPFAFSVAGGDTASALAAGCPVVVKAHEGHPQTSVATAAHREGRAGWGRGAGRNVRGDLWRARGGHAAPATRRSPRPASPGRPAAGSRCSRSAPGGTCRSRSTASWARSTRPWSCPARPRPARPRSPAATPRRSPSGPGSSAPTPGCCSSRTTTACAPPSPARSGPRRAPPCCRSGFTRPATRRPPQLAGHPAVTPLATGQPGEGPWAATPQAFLTSLDEFAAGLPELAEERFGPAGLVITYPSVDALVPVLARLGGNLAGSIHADPGSADDLSAAAPVADVFSRTAGRVIWNGWPTGVAVTWAQHHGGPFPATTSPHYTSVGATAIRRWLIPVTYQDFPDELLPAPLRG